MTINELTTFLGWCTAINISILIFAAIFLFLFKSFAISTHSKLTGVNPAELPTLYFSYMGSYKIGIFLLNLVPYLALKIIQ